ncbi:hypothetical protein BJY01DRAFT_247732 [Aspergillus pseudoustus]|uniref:Uncharacterized protein n=1 Tax=Aspergillus pseudoustus TaxID=1810923 RepID=A0ABR4JYV7_9EURO
MSQLIQAAIFGQLIRFFSGGRPFRYPDEIAPSLSEQLYAESLAQGHQGNGDIEAEGTVAQPETHEKTPDDTAPYIVILDWYGPNDPESPAVKHLIMVQMCLLNFRVYITSSLYVPGEASLMEEFHVSELVATLGLSLFTM